jgi:GNAT superfamily N-acetyltransferase
VSFDPGRVDLAWLRAWLEARSVARGFPMPVLDHGAWRIETGSDTELRRWVFPAVTPQLQELGRAIDDPRMIIRAAVTPEELSSALGARWVVPERTYVMHRSSHDAGTRALEPGYRLETRNDGAVAHVFVLDESDHLAASGHAGRGSQAMAYDRIKTEASHRRKGLGSAVMLALGELLGERGIPEVLVATVAGRALYETIGWRVVAPYAQATLIAP